MTNSFNKITKETYDIVSDNWDEKRRYYWKPVVDFLSLFEDKSNLKLLDLGCGTGRHLELAEKLGFSKKNLFGSDFSKGQLKLVNEKGYNTKVCDMLDLDFENEQFDIIICIAAHHHLLEESEQQLALSEMRRVLKKSGKLLLCNWMPEEEFIVKQLKKKKFDFLTEKKNKVKVTYDYKEKKYDRYYYLFQKEELNNLCEKSEFKIVSEEIFQGNIYLILN